MITAIPTLDPNPPTPSADWLLTVPASIEVDKLVRLLNSGQVCPVSRPWSAEVALLETASEFLHDQASDDPTKLAADLTVVLASIAAVAVRRSLSWDQSTVVAMAYVADEVTSTTVGLLHQQARKDGPSIRVVRTKLAKIVPTVAPLNLLLRGRRNCRSGLPGLRARTASGVGKIRSTAWDVSSKLVVTFEGGVIPPTRADAVILMDAWPHRCCNTLPATARNLLIGRAGR